MTVFDLRRPVFLCVSRHRSVESFTHNICPHNIQDKTAALIHWSIKEDGSVTPELSGAASPFISSDV